MMMSNNLLKDIAIIGAGGFGREVRWHIDRINEKNPQWNFIGFFDDLHSEKTKNKRDIIGTVSDLINTCLPLHIVCAIASPEIRQKIVGLCTKNPLLFFPTLIDPSAIVGKNSKIGHGCVLCANVAVTTDVTIANHVHINSGSTVGHDAKVDSFVTIYPLVSISGNTHLETAVEMGTNSTILQGLFIASKCKIGAGAVVTKNIEEIGGTYVGIPARKL
ncbi:MAG: acetyltransferase [Saccharofermentanales bacterium]|jgi:sugar O-acyltransferase (sialic acid O-acetyltransferase NeuD family)